MTPEQHLHTLRAAAAAFVQHGRSAGLDTQVPTCPDWTVRQLIGHLGRVHRWAAANLRGDTDHATMTDPKAVEKQGRSAADPFEWLQSGVLDLAKALTNAPDDVDALVFLADAGSPREFWARRQAHETTVHAVDALAADLGRLPTARETWVSDEVAVDGIDELVTGFLPRPKAKLLADEPVTIGIRTSHSGLAWLVSVSADPPTTTRVTAAETEAADHLIEGSATSVYLALWNRSDEIESTAWSLWRAAAI